MEAMSRAGQARADQACRDRPGRGQATAVPPGGHAAPSPPVPYATTLHVRDHCLCLHVQRAARALARRFDDELQPLGLTNGQFSLLMSLNRPQPAGMASVAALLAMDRTTLTAALKPLERRRLVTIAPDPSDRRARHLSLTRAGSKLLAKAIPIWTSTHAEIESTFRHGDADALRNGLIALHSTPPSPTKGHRRP